jgi:hypothetical protein
MPFSNAQLGTSATVEQFSIDENTFTTVVGVVGGVVGVVGGGAGLVGVVGFVLLSDELLQPARASGKSAKSNCFMISASGINWWCLIVLVYLLIKISFGEFSRCKAA